MSMQTSTGKTLRVLVALASSGAACFGGVTFTQIHLFPEPGPSAPECTLVETSPGVFYGTTSAGSGGPSTLFMATSAGAFQIMHTFETFEGLNPVGSLTQAVNGTLYGITTGGGANGFGTIFQSDLSGNITVVYNFTEPTNYFPTPYSLIQASDGRLYGTIGSNLSTAYVLEGERPVTLHFFSQAEGIIAGPVMQASDRNLYGLTSVGIYQLSLAGGFKMIYTFSGEDGTNPDGNLTQAANGRLYGVNSFGGANNYGTLFSVSTQGDFRVEHAFTGTPSDLGFPFTGTARADDGSIYGTAGLGGGTLFRVTTGGNFATLLDFPLSMPGGNANFPSPAVIQGSDGKLFGVQTTFGGAVYSADIGLRPPVPVVTGFSPSSGPQGSTVSIVGSDLLGATAVSFNGGLAEFEVLSAHSIVAIVPASASSGPVEVTTPNGAGGSLTGFQVTPPE
jgi:uncharacterized repeat protein (TIGR03803 family)